MRALWKKVECISTFFSTRALIAWKLCSKKSDRNACKWRPAYREEIFSPVLFAPQTKTYELFCRVRRVYNLAISRSTSFHSLPTPEDAHMKKKEQSQQKLPRAVWSIAYKSDVLVIGCNKGSVEVSSFSFYWTKCSFYHKPPITKMPNTFSHNIMLLFNSQ